MSTIPERHRNRGNLLNPLKYGFRPTRLRVEAHQGQNGGERIDVQFASQDDGRIRVDNFPVRVPVEISADD